MREENDSMIEISVSIFSPRGELPPVEGMRYKEQWEQNKKRHRQTVGQTDRRQERLVGGVGGAVIIRQREHGDNCEVVKITE